MCFLSTWLGSAGKLVAWNTPRRWNWVRSSIGVVVIDLRFEFNAKLFRFLDYSWLDSRRPVADSIRCCSIDVQTLNRQISFPFPLPFFPLFYSLSLVSFFFSLSSSSSLSSFSSLSSSSVFNRRRWTRELKRSVKRYRCNYFSARFRCGIVLPLRAGFYRYDFSRVPSTFCFNRSRSRGDCRVIFSLSVKM